MPHTGTKITAKELIEEALLQALGEGVSCGISLRQWAQDENTAITFPVNVTVEKEALEVPFSELAMHVGAAGKKYLAWTFSLDQRSAAIVYDKGNGECAFTDGLVGEVLSDGLKRWHGIT